MQSCTLLYHNKFQQRGNLSNQKSTEPAKITKHKKQTTGFNFKKHPQGSVHTPWFAYWQSSKQ